MYFWLETSAEGKTAYKAPLSVTRYLTGEGQQYGGVAVNIRNDHPSETLKILYFDTYP